MPRVERAGTNGGARPHEPDDGHGRPRKVRRLASAGSTVVRVCLPVVVLTVWSLCHAVCCLGRQPEETTREPSWVLVSETIGLVQLAIAEARRLPALASRVNRMARESGEEAVARLLREAAQSP